MQMGRALSDQLDGSMPSNDSGNADGRAWGRIAANVSRVLPVMPELMPGLRNLAGQFAGKMASRQVHRLARTISELSSSAANASDDTPIPTSEALHDREENTSNDDGRVGDASTDASQFNERLQESTRAIEDIHTRLRALSHDGELDSSALSDQLEGIRKELHELHGSVPHAE